MPHIISTTLPKTYSIRIRKDKLIGFLRFVARQRGDGEIYYCARIVQRRSDASRFVNFDNTKNRAQEYISKYALDEAFVVDDITGKNYGIHGKSQKRNK